MEQQETFGHIAPIVEYVAKNGHEYLDLWVHLRCKDNKRLIFPIS